MIIKWISWLICGLIAAVIYYRKYRTGKDIKNKYIGTEFILFIWGWIGLFYVALMYIFEKFGSRKQNKTK